MLREVSQKRVTLALALCPSGAAPDDCQPPPNKRKCFGLSENGDVHLLQRNGNVTHHLSMMHQPQQMDGSGDHDTDTDSQVCMRNNGQNVDTISLTTTVTHCNRCAAGEGGHISHMVDQEK